MPLFMLDTDICSFVMKRSNEALLNKLAGVPLAQICMSVVTKAELLFGVRVSPDPARDSRALDGLLTYVEVLESPEGSAEHYANIRADLKGRGEMIGTNDLFIAAHARSLGLTLITNNTQEFSRVAGLAFDNWTA